MIFGEMSVTEIGSVVTAIISAFVAAYALLRKTGREDEKKDKDEERADEKTTIAYWRNFAKEQKDSYRKDVDDRRGQYAEELLRLRSDLDQQEVEIDKLRETEHKSRVDAAVAAAQLEQERAEITRLRKENIELRQALAAVGVTSASGVHRMLPPGTVGDVE